MKYKTFYVCLFALLLITACDKDTSESNSTTDTDSTTVSNSTIASSKTAPIKELGYQEIDWEDLVPKGYRPDDVLEEYQEKYNLDELEDNDPIVVEAQIKLRELLASAPVDETLEGRAVKLPGYLLPLDTDGQTTSEFLLVPYFGACIHVPPPPANQTIYVKSTKPVETEGLYDPIWVSGTLKVEHKVSEYADSGYSMTAHIVEEYVVSEEELQTEEESQTSEADPN